MAKNQFWQEIELFNFFYLFSNNYVIIIFLITLASCSSSRTYITAEELKIPKNKFEDNFLEIHRKVERRYSHINSKHIDINTLESKYLKRISNSYSVNDYVLVLSEYFSELQNSHSGLYLKPYIVKSKAKRVGKSIFVDRVVEKVFVNAGISKFDKILAVNNTPILQWLQKEEDYISASTQQDMNERSVRNIFKSNIRIKRNYTFKTKGVIKSVNVDLQPYKLSGAYSLETIHSRVIIDSVGYINIRTFTNNVKTAFEKAYDTMNTLPTLIIDLRENGGGNSSYSEYIVRYLLKNTITGCISGKKLRPRSKGYKGKLFILTSAYTISAAESFLLDLKGNRNTFFIGAKTGGDTGNRAKIFTTSYGMSFKIPTRKSPQISSDGIWMEGKGISPDFEIQLTQNDYRNGIDTILEFTINKILNSK